MKKIHLSGVIGWDITEAEFRDQLEKAGGEDIDVIVSSPGGFVSEALGMFNALKNYPGHSTATLSGIAASAASYIPLAANTIRAEENAVFMIHNVRGMAFGDHNEILKTGRIIQSLSGIFVKAYAKKTGKSTEEIASLMDAETFFFGDEITNNGFANELIKLEEKEEKEEALARATIAFSGCMDVLRKNSEKVKEDFSRAASALAQLAPAREKPEPQKKGAKMNLAELKEKHPDLVAQIEAEAMAGQEEKMKEAKANAAEAERQRIADVNAQLMPGHEKLITELAMDGKTTGPEAAVKILQAEKAMRDVQAQTFAQEAPPPAPQAAEATSATPEEQLKAKWKASASLRDEFAGDFELYQSYMADQDGVVVRVSGGIR